MIEPDDRLAGDPVWEMFPTAAAPHSRRDRYVLAILIVAAWFLWPPLSVTLACVAAGFGDFRTGRQMARSIPDKAGGTICSLFAYAWGAWKLGLTAFGLMFVAAIILVVQVGKSQEVPPACIAAMLLWMGGFLGSAILTAAGLVMAFRSGMRVWIGEGINQARTLMLGMLIVGFTFFVLMPMCLWLSARAPRAADGNQGIVPLMIGLFTFVIGGPVILLVVLDWFSRRVVADRPGKFGPKVPTVGKWNS